MVAVGAACGCGRESSCGHIHIHNQSQNVQSLNTRALGLAPVARLGAEAARRGDSAHSHSHSLVHSRGHNTVDDNLLPLGTWVTRMPSVPGLHV